MHGDYPTNIKFVESTWRESGSNYIMYGGGHSELRVSPGDNVYAEYDDYTLPLPYQENDYKQVTTIAKIVEVSNRSIRKRNCSSEMIIVILNNLPKQSTPLMENTWYLFGGITGIGGLINLQQM